MVVLIAGGLLVSSGQGAFANPPGTGQCDHSACSLCDHQFPGAATNGDYQRSGSSRVIRVTDNGEWVSIQKVKSDGSLGNTRRFVWTDKASFKKIRKNGKSVTFKHDSPAQITQTISTNCLVEQTFFWNKI